MKSLVLNFKFIFGTITMVILLCIVSIQANAQILDISGNYTINPSGGAFNPGTNNNFLSFNEAVDTLINRGVSGAVVIDVASATYDESFIITAISGSSDNNTITFQSETGIPSDVIIQHTGYDTVNHIVSFDGASHIIFQDMTMNSTLSTNYYNCGIMTFNNQANNITLSNNLFFSKPQWDYYETRGAIMASSDQGIYDIKIDSNYFSQGEVAIGFGGGTVKLTGIEITNNTFINQRERTLSIGKIIAPIISGNTFTQDQHHDRQCISMSEITGGFRILNNKFDITQPGVNDGALRIYKCVGDPIGDQRGLVANNMIKVNLDDNGAPGIRVEDSKNIRFYHNTIYHRGDQNANSYSMNILGGSADTDALDIQNNNFSNHTSGYCIYSDNIAYVDNIGHNNYNGNGNYLMRWGDTYCTHLEEIVVATGETGSLSVPPAFVAADDLHARSNWLAATGVDLTSDVPLDFDGIDRTATPSIGANEFAAVGSPLAGTYTIGGTSPNYATIYDALVALGIQGVSAPVTFNLRDDATFNEKIYPTHYGGTDNDNRVTFQSDPANSAQAIISYSGTYTGDQTLGLNRASFITIKDLRIVAENTTNGTVIDFMGYCQYDSIIDCSIIGAGRSGSDNAIESKDDILNHIHFVGNTINNGYGGIYFDGVDNRYGQNLSFVNNIFNEQYYAGIWLQHENKPVISGNKISTSTGASSSYSGISLNTVTNDFKIHGNKIDNNHGLYTGIYINSCTANESFPSLIANNFVTVGGANVTPAGIFTNNANWCNLYHNTVNILSSNTNIEAEAYANSGGSHINLLNNIFSNFGYGRAINNATPSAIDLSDYNCLFAARKILIKWDGDHGRLIDHQTSNVDMDQNSISVNPNYVAEDDLHINSSFLDGMGITGSTGITTDFDGGARSDPPDIGADEFILTRSPIPSGTYSVGESGDYTTVDEAFDSLQTRGISGPVTFQLKSQEFNEIVSTLYEVPGASATDSIVIESESGNPEDVIIHFSTSSDEPNIFVFKGVDNITFRNLTVSATGTSAGRPMAIIGFTENFNIVNNRFSAANNSNAIIKGYDLISDNILIKDNTFTKGNSALYFYGDANNHLAKTRIIGNTINEPYNTGILLKYHDSPKVLNNIIFNKEYSSFEGIQMEYCIQNFEVSGNIINSSNTQYGIYLNNCKATDPFIGLVSNNSVHVGGSYTSYGLYFHYCENINIYNNSAHISSTSTSSGRAIYVRDANLHLNLLNNVASNSGGGYAYYVNDGNDVDASDFNNFYSTGTNLAYWGGTYCTNLDELKASNLKDASSISVDPLFYSDSDLHSMQAALHEKGTPLPEVLYDADSVLRDATKPDIGSYEFFCVTPTFNVYSSPTCLGDSTILIDSSMNIAPASSRGWDLTGDLVPDVYTTEDYESFKWLFDDSGNNLVTYIVSQIAGCNDFENIDVPITPQPILDVTTKGAYCDTTDGWAKVSVTNLSGPFQYFWSDGQNDSTATGLDIGTYTVAVTDETGCTTTEKVSIGEAIEVTVTQLSPSTCGIPDGSAEVSATGGFEPYTYVWSNGETESITNSLPPGSNYVNVIDSEGCYAQGIINIESDGGPQIDLVGVINNECYGEKNGSIDISISGGIAPYNILWSNGESIEDIDTLAAGIYNVSVEDSEGCMGAGSFQVFQPSKIAISPVITPATCEGADGSAVAIISGGTKPFTYQWSTGGIYQIEHGLAAGVYSVAVIDGKGCEMVEPVIVSNIDAPVVTITDIQGTGCTITDNGSISISASPPNPFYKYSWSSGENTPTISNLIAGSYDVTVTDEAGCKGVGNAVVTQEPPDVNPICLVTVDTLTGMNMIVWEKSVTEDVSHYNIYRESSVKGDYQVIASVDVDSLSLYVDSIADPTIRSWRYRLSVVDDCGNESELSEPHKTMHLTMNVGLDESVNLIWDHYEGFPIETYEIWRYDAIAGWLNIENMPSNLTSYTDANPPVEDLTYFIEVDHPVGCTALDKKAASLNSSRSNRKSKIKSGGGDPGSITIDDVSVGEGDGTATFTVTLNNAVASGFDVDYTTTDGTALSGSDYTTSSGTLTFAGTASETQSIIVTISDDAVLESSESYTVDLSNITGGLATIGDAQGVGTITDNDAASIEDLLNIEKFNIYPNPGEGLFNLNLDIRDTDDVHIMIFNISGKLVMTKEYYRILDHFETQIDLTGFSDGLYQIHVKTSNALLHRILIKE